MLNSYEVKEKVQKKIHLPVKYSLEVVYNPIYCLYGFFISKNGEVIESFNTSSDTVNERIEKYGLEYEAEAIESDLIKMINEITLDELVEYYYKKGKKMSEINDMLVRRGSR